MKNFFRAGLILLIAAAYSPVHAATATARVSATVVRPLQIVSQTPLNFGFVKPDVKGGKVMVSPQERNGSRSSARFLLQGEPSRSYIVHTPDRLTFEVRGAKGAKGKTTNLEVTKFVIYSANASKTGHIGVLNSRGKDTLWVGATLIVPSHAAPGHYSGNVPITVAYQ